MDNSASTPDLTTRLAVHRNYMSAERTLMAWIRTAISMIGFGFTVAKLFQSLAAEGVLLRGPAGNVWSAEGVGILLISLGTFALIAAVFDHRREVRQLRAEGMETRLSLPAAVGTVLAILGVMALLSITVRF